jgi:hypothetical protein
VNQTPTQLLDEAKRRIKTVFTALEMETADQLPPDERKRIEPITLNRQPASYLKFEGKQGTIPISGECYALSYRGFSYWVISWAPVESYRDVARTFGELRAGFVLGAQRQNWAENVNRGKVYEGKNGVKVRDLDGKWEVDPYVRLMADPDQPESVAVADLALRALDPKDKKDLHKAARFRAMLVPMNGDVMNTAREHAQKQIKAEFAAENMKFEEANKGGPNEPITGTLPKDIFKLKVSAPAADNMFVIVAGLAVGDKVLVMQGACDEPMRTMWEGKILSLMANVQK